MSAHIYVKSHLELEGVTGWVVRVGLYRATNIKKADRVGKSDPYAVVYVNGVRRARSPCLKRTLNPHWEEIMEFAVPREDLGSLKLSDATLELALFDMDRVGKDDFLGGVQLQGSDFMNFAALPLERKPAWEIDGKRLREFELTNFPPHPEIHDLKGKVAFWAEIRPDEDSERFFAALKIQAMRRGGVDRAQVKRQIAARKIQARQRGKNQRRKFEKTKHAYLAFSVACSHIKKWAGWNDLSLDEIFADMDRDSDGGLTAAEIKKFFASHPSVDLLSEDIDAILFHMDPNQDGTIDEAEFINTIRNSDEVTEKIKKEWDASLKKKALDLRVLDMGRAWRTVARERAKAKRNGAADSDIENGVGKELAARRRRRASRWSAEFEHLKAQQTKRHTDHLKKKLTAEERRVHLHKQWRRESKRRLKMYEKRRGELQQRLLKEQSERLRAISSEEEAEDETELGYSDADAEDARYGIMGNNSRVPKRPDVRRRGTAAERSPMVRRISPENKKRSLGAHQKGREERPRSPSQLERKFRFYSCEMDRKTKRVFYRNINTGETVWRLPEGGVVYPPLPKPETPKPKRISPFTFNSMPSDNSTGGQDTSFSDVQEKEKESFGGDNNQGLEEIAQSIGSLTVFDFRVSPDVERDNDYDVDYDGDMYSSEGFEEIYDDDY
eukprot:g575.t1